MAVLALAAAGAWLAPAGYAALGWTIGSAVGQAIFAKSQTITQEGPRLSDLSVQTSTDGAPIVDVHGTARIAGNIIWSAGIRESRTDTSQEVGGKGGGGTTVTSTTYSYSCSFALSLCQGPITGVRRIWADGKLMYTALATASIDDIQASARLAQGMEIYLGSSTQMPSPTIEAHEGAGNVPGYRGQAYLVFRDLPLANYGNRIPNITVEVVQAGTTGNTPHSVAIVSPSGVSFSGAVPAIFSMQNGVVRVGAVNTTTVYQFNMQGVYLGVDQRAGDEVYFPAQSGSALYPVGMIKGCAVNYVAANLSGPISSGDILRITRVGTFVETKVADFTDPLPDAEYVGGCALSADGEHAIVMTSPTTAVTGHNVIDKWYLVRFDGTSVTLVDSGTVSPGKSIYNFGFGGVTYYHYGCCALESDLRHIWFGYSASGVITLYEINDAGVLAAVYTSPAQPTGSTYPSIFADDAVAVLVMGNVVVTYTRAPYVTPGAPAVSAVVSTICLSAGLQAGEIDVTSLTGTVDGYVRTQPMTARAALETLMRAYYFDAIESGNVIKFVPRGGASAATIAEADLAAHADTEALPDAISIERDQELELPRAVTVLYMDQAADYQQGSQRSTRLITSGRSDITVELPMVLTANRARQVADVLLADAWMSRRRFPLALPPKYIDIEPADVITLQGASATHVVRVVDQEIGANGVIRVQAVAEAASTYTSQAPGAAPAIPAQSLTLVGPTNLQMLDIPLLRDNDDTPGCYLAAAGYFAAWKGAVIEQSRDGGESFAAIASKLSAAVMGFATTALAAGPTSVWDNASTLNVRIPVGTLSSSTEDGVLGGANVALLGVHGRWEVLQFRDAVLEANGTWTLSHFLRGCFGTEYATDKHAIGDVFVLVTPTSLLRLTQSQADIGLALKYHALSIGAPSYTPAVIDFTNAGASQRPYPVAGLAGIKQANGDWLIQWMPRVRKGQNWMQVASIAADPAISGYQLDIMSGSTVKRSVYVTGSTSFTYPLAAQNTDFGEGQSTLKVRVYGYNSAVGLGHGIEITAPSDTETYLAPAAFTAVPYIVPTSDSGITQDTEATVLPPLTDIYFYGTEFIAAGGGGTGFWMKGDATAAAWTVMTKLGMGAERGVRAGSYYGWMGGVGWFGRSSTAADGSWTYYTRDSHPLRNLGGGFYFDMCSDGTRFICVGDRGILESTTDFVTWTEHAVGQIGLAAALTLCRYASGVYIVFGTDVVGDVTVARIWRSTDRNTWTDVTPAGIGAHRLSDMVYAGGKWVAVGQKPNQYKQTLPAIWVSSDNGVTWVEQTAGGLVNQTIGHVVHTGTKFVAVGAGYRGTSADGTTWTAYDDGQYVWGPVANNGSLIVSARSGSPGTTPYLVKSTDDGVTWTTIQ